MLPSFASTARVNVKPVSLNCGSRWRRKIDFVFYRLPVIGKLQVGAIDAVEFPNHSQKICLSTKQVSHNDSCALPQPLPSQMFAGEHALRLDKLLVKLREWQLRRQYCVLDVKQTVIGSRETEGLIEPRFCSRQSRLDVDFD